MNPTFETITFDLDAQGVATVTINRPDKLNALNSRVLNELSDVFREVPVNNDIRAVLVAGSGSKAFVAGADIRELSSLNEHSARMFSQKGQQIFQSIEDSRKPVIAVVQGYALGGGAELAMACHMRVASENAVFGLPEAGLGIIPGYGGTQRLAQLVGRARALEIIVTGRHIRADEALKIGLVNRVVKEDPRKEAENLTSQILKNAPLAVESAIKAVYQSDSRNGYLVEADLFGALCNTSDFREGTGAFLEKRKPEFKGR